jgi:hypothetical protein
MFYDSKHGFNQHLRKLKCKKDGLDFNCWTTGVLYVYNLLLYDQLNILIFQIFRSYS